MARLELATFRPNSGRLDSNQRSPDPQPGALPTKLRPEFLADTLPTVLHPVNIKDLIGQKAYRALL
ncbi:MAG: hypothetical protein HW405_162 [Candidatus Berkelbacteria bacterium]|nr:hypothetical protein [Candidatus Berkelbacteria bacterium]